ncbi:MAG: 50S ribosomal protein L21 [Candidatus Yonathbacteria bacterium RIFCSPHIGHO2_01_FULL_51_10]|uniref:Large ribosomal subunit protein bL21 n=1 Tax=Candidatus Yonathbacteria bacterium RIFCSPHIGHO2_01_FULL_51_10 TaxID=1802723 RepID=A0A1G2S8W2_9BACT|nr:MAG: 50S ribosomal protein L21 [Candidatus Yonathbacteria bacterium RIFCSPHIGHO2_01_FULL_51_10]
MTTKKLSKKEGDFAVIKTGGKQYKVVPGQTLKIEKLSDELKAGDAVSFDQVLLVTAGGKVSVGTPTIAGATVKAEYVRGGRADKITVIKYKQKSRYFKKRGHKQPFAEVKISTIK